MWPFSGYRINVYSKGLQDCFSYKVKDHFTVADVKQKAAANWKIEDPQSYELFVTDGNNREASPVQLSDNDMFRDLKRNYDSELIYYIYQQPKSIPDTSATASTTPPKSPQEPQLYPKLSFADGTAEFVNPARSENLYPSVSNGSSSPTLSDWHIFPADPPSPAPPSRQFSNSIYTPLATVNVSFLKDPTAHLPNELKSLNLASLTMIPHEILNFRFMSQGVIPVDLTLERDIIHAYSVEESRYKEAAMARRSRIEEDEKRVEEQILCEAHEKEEAARRKREQEEQEKARQIELQRQQQLQREREQRELEKLQRQEREEWARLEQLRMEQQVQEARRLQQQREKEERELLELKRQQEAEKARMEQLRREQEIQQAKLRDEEEQRRKDQEFVEQLLLFETQKVSVEEDAPPPYRPLNDSSPSNCILLDLPPPGHVHDPFVQQFVEQGNEEEVVKEAIRVCGQNAQQVAGYLGEYNYYLSCGFNNRALVCQGLRLFGRDKTKCFQLFSSGIVTPYEDGDVYEAMQRFQGDIEKALQFLDALQQLKEMGMEGQRAKEALFSSANDVNAAAAILLDN